LFFYKSFIQFVIEIDNYFDKIKYVANKFVITYSFVFKIVFKILSKYHYKYNIVLFDKINIFFRILLRSLLQRFSVIVELNRTLFS
jgi:HD superfamily phosphohydrolase